MIALNSENLSYLDNLEASRGLSRGNLKNLKALELKDSDIERRLNLYRDLLKKYPKSFAIKQRLIFYTPNVRFEEAVKDYIISSIQKGVPSLFVTTRDLFYGDSFRAQVIEKVISNLINGLEGSGKVDGSADLDPPTTLLWSYFYMSQHLDWKKQYLEALKVIEKAIDHTPTLVEAYMIKAKILKHSGSFLKASEEMDNARKLDLQDRFINSKCTKYMFRAGRIQDAEKTVSLFTRVLIIQDD